MTDLDLLHFTPSPRRTEVRKLNVGCLFGGAHRKRSSNEKVERDERGGINEKQRYVDAMMVSSMYIFSLEVSLLVGSFHSLVGDCFRFSLCLFFLSFSPHLHLLSPLTAMW